MGGVGGGGRLVTAIVGYGEGPGGTAWLGTDGYNTVGHDSFTDQSKQVVRRHWNGVPVLFAVAGFARAADLVAEWPGPDVFTGADDLPLLAHQLGEWLHDPDRWDLIRDDEDEAAHGCNLLVAADGVVGVIDGRFHLAVPARRWVFGGCAGEAAMAAALAHRDHDVDWPDALRLGLEAAAHVDAHVGEPFTVISTER